MKKPIIGIMMRTDISKDNRSIQYIYDTARSAIIECGGEPLLLCPPKNLDYSKTKFDEYPDFTNEEIKNINFWLDMCDGLFLPGGNKYSKYDCLVFELALKRDLPILGVCLGMQIMSNYKKEFKLEKINSSINHYDTNKKYCHQVKIKKDSLLYKIIDKEQIEVNSYHKIQAFPNNLFDIVAVAPDGVIEAIQMKEKKFVLGVQWHPEKMVEYDKDALKLMNYFINEAIIYKEDKDKKVIRV